MSKDEISTAPELPGEQSEEPLPTEQKESEETTQEEEPKLSKEESVLQAAGEHMDDADEPEAESAGEKKVGKTKPKTKKSHKKLWITLAVLVALAVVGASVWYFVLREKTGTPSSESATKTAKEAAASAEAPKTYVPDVVAYAYKANQTDPFSVFYRPAVGGERKEAQKLDRDYYPSLQHAFGQTVVFGSESKLFISTDGGKKYAVLYAPAAGEAITSVRISNDGSRVAIASVPDFGENVKGSVFSVDLAGKDKQEVFTADKYAIYLIGWNQAKQKMAYSEGCYGCDGGRAGFKLRDLKTKTSKDLAPALDPRGFSYNPAVSDDLSTAIYYEATVDTTITGEGPPGYYSAAPYTIKSIDLNSQKVTAVTTIGTKSEKNANGTEKYRQFYFGFLAGTNTPYYAEGNQLYAVVDGKPNLLYQADKSFTGIFFASDKNVIAGVETATLNDFTLSNYNITEKKAVPIFEGDGNTIVFGVTTN